MYSVRVLGQELQDDFDARGVLATVDYGNWEESQHKGAARVILGLGDFDPDAQNFPNVVQPGTVVIPGADTAAAVVAVQAQEVIIWVHDVAPEGTAPIDIPKLSHDRTGVLLHATISGLRRVGGRAALIFVGKGTWPSVTQGDITYGSLAKLKCAIAIPVLGDPWPVVPKPYKVTATVSMKLPGGDHVGATVQVPPIAAP